jgi:hypothetical protein
MIIFIRFIYCRIYNFYNSYWPQHDPGHYAFFGVVLLFGFNTLGVFFLIEELWGIRILTHKLHTLYILAFYLIFCYYILIYKRKNKKFDKNSFIFKGLLADFILILYIIFVFTFTTILSFYGRQRNLQERKIQEGSFLKMPSYFATLYRIDQYLGPK